MVKRGVTLSYTPFFIRTSDHSGKNMNMPQPINNKLNPYSKNKILSISLRDRTEQDIKI